MTHLIYGYPTVSDSMALLDLLDLHSRYIEIQIPFSDPIADGTIISDANTSTLKQKIEMEDVFEVIWQKRGLHSDILIMCYFHTIYHYGIESFMRSAKSAWIYGIIVPDIPLDEPEWELIYRLCQEYWLYFIVTVSPRTSDTRLSLLSEYAQGFIYAISANMTTGTAGTFEGEFDDYIDNLRRHFTIPIGVWFWVRSGQDVEKVNSVADFSIIGSQIVSLMTLWWLSAVREFLENL